MDELADEAFRVVNPGYELWDDLEPSVNVYGADSIGQGLAHIRHVSVIKPQSQQPAEIQLKFYTKSDIASIVLQISVPIHELFSIPVKILLHGASNIFYQVVK